MASSPTPVKRIVIAAEPVTSVDVTSVDAITELFTTLGAAQIELQAPAQRGLAGLGRLGGHGPQLQRADLVGPAADLEAGL